MERYNCGCTALRDDNDEFLNGSYALWPEIEVGMDGPYEAECYGTLCDECIPMYDAVKCKIGGVL